MRFATPSLAILSSRNEKEAKLKKFIAEALAECAGAGELPACVTLVARSFDSPVACALNTVISALAKDSPSLRVIVMDDSGANSFSETPAGEFRVFRDARFGDAHEQLIVSTQAVWTGDCMRRDPAKRDAFEIYSTGDANRHDNATASFDKLWDTAAPVRRAEMPVVATALIAAEQTNAEAASGQDTHR